MKNKGFTLIELLVVIGIISILSFVFLIGLGGEENRKKYEISCKVYDENNHLIYEGSEIEKYQ